MPGPKKAQAQRVKGNLKPSSSSQAAQLLAAAGQSPVGFIGFSTQPAFVPASETFDEIDNSLDADFRLVLRKLSKKDTVTKIKALQELVSLCDDKSEADILAVLPFWPRLYNKVALDVDHKVRELSQKAMMVLVNRTGKNMAPHLKSVMGAWMVSMCDTYPSVATAATSAFTGTFSAVKQKEALRFCKTDIANCLLANILRHTAQTLSDPLTTSEEDMTAKYNRVVSSSLQAFRKLCTMLPPESVDPSMAPHFTELLNDLSFWKHTKSSVPLVKAGLLNLLSCICQFCPEVSSQFVKKISPFVFSCMDTLEPAVVSHAWEAVLSLISAHEDCWDHVNWQKAVWPKLKKLLEGGCSGLAVIIAPCFLPLLSKLPRGNFMVIFDAMRVGMTKECLLNSESEMSAFVQAFFECVQYCIKHILEPDASKISDLLIDQLLVIVEAGLTEEKPCLSKSPLFALVPPIIASVGTSHPDVEELFWRELSTFIGTQLISCQHQTTLVMADTDVEKNNQCLKSLLNRLVSLAQGIVFHKAVSSPSKPLLRPAKQQPHGVEASSSVKQKQAMSHASQTVLSDLLVMSFCMAEECESTQFLSLFTDVVAMHIPASAGKRLTDPNDALRCRIEEEVERRVGADLRKDEEIESRLAGLLDGCGSGLDEDVCHLRNFLYSRLLKLLLYHQRQDDLDLSYAEDLLMCMFSFLTYLPEEDGSQFLSSTLEVLSAHLVTCLFIEQLLQQANIIPACRKAVESLGISVKISELATEVMETLGKEEEAIQIRRKTEPVWKMLSSVLFYLNGEEGDSFPPSCVDSIMTCCISSLKWLGQSSSSDGSRSMTTLTSLVQSLLDKQDVSFHSAFADLLLSILSLVLSSSLGSDAVEELESAWSLCLTLIRSQPSGASYMTQVCTFIRDWVCSHLHTVKDLDRVTKVVKLMSASGKENIEEGDDEDQEKTEHVARLSKNKSDDDVMNVVSDPISVDQLDEVMADLCIKGCLSPLDKTKPDPQSNTLHILPVTSYALVAIHNLRTVCLSRTQGQGHERTTLDLQAHSCHPVLVCLARLAENFAVLEVIGQTHAAVLKEMSPVQNELERGMLELLSSLTHQQLSALVNMSLNSSSLPLASLGLEKLLTKLLQSDIIPHSSKACKVGRRTLKIHFLYRYISSISSAEEVVNLLKDKSEISGSDLSEAFTLTSSLLISLETSDLNQISGSITGFLALLEDMKEVTQETKSVVFHQTLALVKHLKTKGIYMLTGSDASLATDVAQVHLNVCVARLISATVLYHNHDYWEFALCTLIEWLQFLTEVTVSAESDVTLQALMMAIFQVAQMAADTFSKAAVVPMVTADTPPFAVLEKVKTEWREFFSDGIFSTLLPLYVSLASQCLSKNHSNTWLSILKPLASAASMCPPNLLLEHQLPARLSVTDGSALPDNMKSLLNHVCPLLNAKERHIGIAAFNIVNSVVDCIPEHEIKVVSSPSKKEDEQEEEEARSPPEAIALVVEGNAIYLDCLMTVDIEVGVTLEPTSEEYAHAMGYLLAWRLLLQLFKCSPNELRAKYAQFFRNQESVSHLLDHLFRLMPSTPSKSLLEFNSALHVADDSEPQELFSVALNVYRQCLEVIPALVRTWWVDQNRKTSNFVDRFTTDFLSSSLCWQQLTSPQMINSNIEDITIRARPAAGEVCAMYQMAEVTINMTITLPKNYPLGKVDVVCDKRVGVSQPQWDRWLLQLNIFLQHQNGSIVEGLKLWKGNIDKKFEGIDDCMICFSVIHGTTFQLPRLTCRTCRKKFHSSCLYKWFHTSQKSSCPLCRNLF